jgi:hypothetical protein
VARSLVPDFEDWVTIGRPEASAEVRLSYDAGVDGWSGAGRTPNSAFLASLKWSTDATLEQTDYRGIQPALKGSGTRNYHTRGPWQDNPTGWFCAAYGPFRRLVGGSVAQRTGQGCRLPGPAGGSSRRARGGYVAALRQ